MKGDEMTYLFFGLIFGVIIYEVDKEATTTLIRFLVSGLLIICAVICRIIAFIVRNKRLEYIANYLFLIFTGFAILRIVAAFLDSYWDFSVGLFSNIVNFGFYLYWIYLLSYALYRLTRKPVDIHQIGAEEKNAQIINNSELSELFDEVFDTIGFQKKETAKIKKNLNKLQTFL